MTICSETRATTRKRSVMPGFTRILSLLCIAFELASCAAIQPPPGGPEEKTPPKVDTTTPHMRQTNVPRDTRFYFKFDRAVDRSAFVQSLSITPYLNGILKYHWSGYDEVTVELPEKLRDSTTYTVQLSRDLKSKRGNALAEPIRIMFSTGPAIDTGSLAGFLLTPIVGASIRASDIFINAYDISIRNADTLNVTATPADIITQPNDQGVWQFLAMKTGHRYRVFAAADVYRNRTYDPGVDAFGVPASDALLDSAVKTNFYIRMSPATDSIRPELQDVDVVDSFHIRARFSEAIDSEDIRTGLFTMTGAQIVAAYRENVLHKPGQITLLVAAPLKENQSYTLAIQGDSIHDMAGNPVSDSARRVTFTTPGSLGKLSPLKLLAVGVTDSVSDVSLTLHIPVSFTDAVDRASIESGLVLRDSSRVAIPAVYQWNDDAHVTVSPRDTLHSIEFYTLQLQKRAIVSPVPAIPRETKDTTVRFRFRTTDARNFGRLTGDITIADSFFVQPKSAIVLQLLNQTTNEIRTMVLDHGVKHFSFTKVQGGTYRVRGYLSIDGSTRYDPGSVMPWRFGVPTGDFPGTVEARPRWEISKINFDIR